MLGSEWLDKMFWYECRKFRCIYILFGLTFLLQGLNIEGSKCPYKLINIGSSLIHPVAKNERNLPESIWDFFESIYESIFGSGNPAMDELGILPPPTSGYTDCQNASQPDPVCNSSYPYRTYDGSCNNLEHPTWGMAGECQLRLLPAVYDGTYGFRKSEKGKPLPEPRHLSVNVLPDEDHPNPILSHMFAFFGQFVTHDMMKTPTPTRSIDNCCPYDERNKARIECVPIFVKPDDPFYSQYNRTCINFERANMCAKCSQTGEIQKANIESAAFDLSQVYGTSEEEADELREKDGTGRLKFETDNKAQILPRNIGYFSNFCPDNQFDICFQAGDDRVDQHATLTSIQTLFLREHNRLATKLKVLNPHWEEEKLFQEARKIFGGQWQNMIYGEYLPFALGPRHMTHFGLWVGKDDTRTQYNASARLGTFLEVSTSGFRLHSQVASKTGLKKLRFFQTYSNPSLIREGCTETLLEGACKVQSQEFDRFFVTDVSGFFLKQPTDPDGLDTGSIDIQRGRDNGMPLYKDAIEHLTAGQTKVASFDDLNNLMPQKNIDLLKNNYDSVSDVDLWLGLQLESHAPKSNAGFNSATLSALQFHYLKYGDRFYFENGGEEASFTKDQLEAIRKSSFSRLLCDNTKVQSIQKYALLIPSSGNRIVKCNRIAEVDLTPWQTDD